MQNPGMSGSYRFTVSGRVQGVGFRIAAQRRAEALGLRGWVRNHEAGSVEGRVAGADAAALEQFRDWLQQGPAGARVERVDWLPADADVDPAPGFVVRR